MTGDQGKGVMVVLAKNSRFSIISHMLTQKKNKKVDIQSNNVTQCKVLQHVRARVAQITKNVTLHLTD